MTTKLTEDEAIDLLASREPLPAKCEEDTFELKFEGKRLGIFVRPGHNGNNAVVDRITSEYAFKNDVRVRDQLIGINGKNIIDLPFGQITRIVQSVGQPVYIRFKKGPRNFPIHSHPHKPENSHGECAAWWAMIGMCSILLLLAALLAFSLLYDTDVWSNSGNVKYERVRHRHTEFRR